MKYKLEDIWDRWNNLKNPIQDKNDFERISYKFKSELADLVNLINDTVRSPNFIRINYIEELDSHPECAKVNVQQDLFAKRGAVQCYETERSCLTCLSNELSQKALQYFRKKYLVSF